MSVTGDEPMDAPHGDDAAPADQPEADADETSAPRRPPQADPPDPEAMEEFRAAIEPQ